MKESRDHFEALHAEASAAEADQLRNAAEERSLWDVALDNTERILGLDPDAARRKLDGFVSAEFREADSLNREYDRVRSRLREALESLVEFERDKLGMERTSRED